MYIHRDMYTQHSYYHIYVYIHFIGLRDIIEAFYFKVFFLLFFNFVNIGKQPMKGVYWPKVRNKCYK